MVKKRIILTIIIFVSLILTLLGFQKVYLGVNSSTKIAVKEESFTVEIEEVPEIEEVEEIKEISYLDFFTEEDVTMCCKLIWGEGRGVSKKEQAAILWCALNRLDDKRFPNTLQEVITAKKQFTGYKAKYPVKQEIKEIVEDVLLRYCREKQGEEEVGRTLPSEYLFFYGDGKHNHFRKEYKSKEEWDWSLADPYTTQIENEIAESKI